MIGAQFLVPFDFDFWHDFEAGLEMQAFTIVRVQVGDAGLRNRHQAEPLGFFAEIFRNECVNDIILYVLRKPLANDGGRHMAAAKSRNTGQLLVFLDQRVGFAGDFLRRHFDFDLSLRAYGGFSWTHSRPFILQMCEDSRPRLSSGWRPRFGVISTGARGTAEGGCPHVCLNHSLCWCVVSVTAADLHSL